MPSPFWTSAAVQAQAPESLDDTLKTLEQARRAVKSSGDNTWVLAGCALVLFTTGPGLAQFYAGLVRRKNVFATRMHGFILMRRWNDRYEVRVLGCQKGHKEVYRGQEHQVDLLPKVKPELIVVSPRAGEVVQTLSKAARTGKIGDGEIFVHTVEEAIRIRNDERGEAAL